MDRQPILEGARLMLRPLAPEDRDALFAVACDPELWAQHPVPERSEEAYFNLYFEKLLERRGTLVIVRREDGALIGSSTYSNHRREGGGAVEIGSTFIARMQWGGTTNRELKHLMLNHAFRTVALVEFLIGEENWRSRRATEKIGAILTDRVVMVENAGRGIPHLVYEITRDDFLAGPLAS